MRRLGVLLGTAVVAGALFAGCGGSSDDSTVTVTSPPVSTAEVEAREETEERLRDEAEARRAKANAAKMEHEELEVVLAEERAAKKRAAKKRKAEAKTAQPKDTEAEACGHWPGPEQSACEMTYLECSGDAAEIVTGYYEETGPDMMKVAEERADHFYGHSGWASREAAFAGCYAAFSDKYDALYR